MNLGELKKFIEENPNLPDEIEIYIHADHGQTVESADIQHEVIYKDDEIEIIHPDDMDDYDPHEEEFQGALVFWGG